MSRSDLKECGQLRTLASLERQRLKWVDASGDLKMAKEYGNVVNRPIFGNDDNTLVLDILPPPGENDITSCKKCHFLNLFLRRILFVLFYILFLVTKDIYLLQQVIRKNLV